MNIIWKYRYVPEGQMEPDEMNRWALDGYIAIKPEHLKGYEKFPVDTMFVQVATIIQKETRNGLSHKGMDKFSCHLPAIHRDARLSYQNFYHRDLEELKSQVQDQLNNIQHIFNHSFEWNQKQ